MIDAKAPRFPLVRFDDVLLTTTAVYLVKDLIPASSLVLIWGEPKCGKSFWLFDVLMHVALGWEYRGLRVKAGTVVYIALEGASGFKRRVEAFRRRHPEAKGAEFYLIFAPLDLIRDHKALVASIRAQLSALDTVAVVAIDTLNRSLRGSECSAEDMPSYVRAADAIRDAFDCCVPIIHHCGHNGGRPRGHSSILGAADTQIAVKRQGAISSRRSKSRRTASQASRSSAASPWSNSARTMMATRSHPASSSPPRLMVNRRRAPGRSR